MDTIDFREFGGNLVASARAQFKEFLEENKDVDDFLVRIGEGYAVRTAEYHLAATDEDRADAAAALRRIRNTLDLQLDAIAHVGKSEILGQIKAALGMALEFAIQNLPTILKLVRK